METNIQELHPDQRKCLIINGHFHWFLEVDGERICFTLREAALYFARHYHYLGYTLEFNSHCVKDIPLTIEEFELYLNKKREEAK